MSVEFHNFPNIFQDPKNKGLRYWKTDFHDGTYKITYTPEDVGEHKISVKFDDEDVAAPFVVQSLAVGDADKCAIKGRQNANFTF